MRHASIRRFFHQRSPRKPSLASMPGPYGRASHPGRSSRHGSPWSLPFGIRLAIPPAGGRRSLIVRAPLSFGLKRFIDAHASISMPSTLKCSFDNARFARGCANSNRRFTLQQAVPALRECRMIPYRIVDPEPNDPAEQKIELQTLHELSLRADRIKRL
jgi:hypothetical protein